MNAPLNHTPFRPYRKALLSRAAGFTLVEILTALFVLVIGICGTLAIVMRSAQMGTAASDRNNASILIPEAIDEIKRTLILSSNDATHYGITSDHVGEFMDTVGLYDNTNPFATVSLPNYPTGFTTFKGVVYPLPVKDSVTGNNLSLAYWPLTTRGARVLGQRLTGQPGESLGTNGNTYRALFKLEPHPEWIANPFDRNPLTRENTGSAFVGVYVLTLTMYRDLNPDRPVSDNTKKLQQISDPVVVFLHDSKVRQ